MNAPQKNLIDMFRNVVKWLKRNLSGLSAAPDLDATLPEFESKVEKIDQVAGRTESTSTGATEAKARARRNLTLAMMKMINALKLFATRTKNIALLNEVDFREYQLVQSSGQLLISRGYLVVDKANSVVGDEQAPTYKVTPEGVTALETALENFKDSTTDPRQIIAARKNDNELLDALIDDADDFLKENIDLQMAMIEYDEPNLYNEYQNVRMIVD